MRRGWVCAGYVHAQDMCMRRGWVCAGYVHAQDMCMRRGWVCAGAGCAQDMYMRRGWVCAGARDRRVLDGPRYQSVSPRSAHRATCRMQHTTYNIGALSLAQTAATHRAPLALPCARPAAHGIGRAARSWTSCTRSRAQRDTTCRCPAPGCPRAPLCHSHPGRNRTLHAVPARCMPARCMPARRIHRGTVRRTHARAQWPSGAGRAVLRRRGMACAAGPCGRDPVRGRGGADRRRVAVPS
jgi:hypothetical protein